MENKCTVGDIIEISNSLQALSRMEGIKSNIGYRINKNKFLLKNIVKAYYEKSNEFINKHGVKTKNKIMVIETEPDREKEPKTHEEWVENGSKTIKDLNEYLDPITKEVEEIPASIRQIFIREDGNSDLPDGIIPALYAPLQDWDIVVEEKAKVKDK